MDNLREAFLKSAKGKSNRNEVIRFRENLDDNLLSLRNDLLCGSYMVGKYHCFEIFDPKRRLICAARFRDRVAFHAMMKVCHKVFDDFQIFHSYASRVGKGTYKAIEQAQVNAKKYKWFAKLDVCHYFDSIDHSIMINQISSLLKDKIVLKYFFDLLDSPVANGNKGLPIGNLTSQYFANHYLSVADHFLLEKIHADAYLRYMDDMLIFSSDLQSLKCKVALFSQFLHEHLKLDLHPVVYNKVCHGIPFLGYVVYPHSIRLNQRSRHRFRHKFRLLNKYLSCDVIDQSSFRLHYLPLRAFVDKANAVDFIKNVYDKSIPSL